MCDSPERIYDYWVANVMTAGTYNPDAECCCAIHLNTRRRATGLHLVGIGTLDVTPCTHEHRSRHLEIGPLGQAGG